jgi:hypothetical protein
MHRSVRCVRVVVLAILMTGCSTRAWYEGVRMGAQNRCAQQPPGADKACRDRLSDKPYDDYEKERTEIRK